MRQLQNQTASLEQRLNVTNVEMQRGKDNLTQRCPHHFPILFIAFSFYLYRIIEHEIECMNALENVRNYTAQVGREGRKRLNKSEKHMHIHMTNKIKV